MQKICFYAIIKALKPKKENTIEPLLAIVSVLAIAVLGCLILNKLKIPTIIGYILTGVFTAYFFDIPLSKDGDLNHIAEMGIVFLMFTIGLEFSFKTISSMKEEVLLFGGLQIILSILTIFLICNYLFGFNASTSIIVSSAISLSSTAIVLKYLNENSLSKTLYGKATVGILIFQDLAVIPILLIIKLLSDKSSSISDLLITTFVSALIVLVLLLLPGKFLAKIVLRLSANMKTDEIFVGTVFLIVLGAAYISHYFGFSLTLGAFLAGMIISNTPYKYQVENVLIYFKDLLLGVFFITIGMQVDLDFLSKYFVLIIIFVILMMLVKAFVIYSLLKFFRGNKISMQTALSLSQIGEFSFAVFLLASQNKILNLKLEGGILNSVFGKDFFEQISAEQIYQFLTIMVIFSMVATPFLLEKLEFYSKIALKFLTLKKYQTKTSKVAEKNKETIHKIIICGYGILGQNLCSYLRACDVDYICIDNKYEKVEKGLKKGDKIIYGDVTHKNLFRHLKVEQCVAVVMALRNPETSIKSVKEILSINHHTKIIVSTKFDNFEAELKNMGIYCVIHERRELAQNIGKIILEAIKDYEEENPKNKTES